MECTARIWQILHWVVRACPGCCSCGKSAVRVSSWTSSNRCPTRWNARRNPSSPWPSSCPVRALQWISGLFHTACFALLLTLKWDINLRSCNSHRVTSVSVSGALPHMSWPCTPTDWVEARTEASDKRKETKRTRNMVNYSLGCFHRGFLYCAPV